MADFELSDSLKESGIEEIKALGLHLLITHKEARNLKDDPYQTGKSLEPYRNSLDL